jgi:LysR family transcriptional regulator for metE and metH
MIEKTHLAIIRALAENGSLTSAANALHVTQPALSHQIRYLEQKLEVSLWQKQGRNIRLTQAGELLLKVANQVLPVFEQTEETLKAYAQGKQGFLRLGVECHPCYEWLKPVLNDYLAASPAIDVDVIDKFQFSGLEGLLNHHIDILVTPDEMPTKGVSFVPLFDYELVLVVSDKHVLASSTQIEATQLIGETLLTFPVAKSRLDIFTRFLLPASVSLTHKTMQSLDMMLQLVQLNRGITVLPDWLAKRYEQSLDVKVIKLQPKLDKTLFAAVKQDDLVIPHIAQFLDMAGASHRYD